jgi:hypothetical protein
MTFGITISTLLKANSALLALVPTGNIFPYVANENTALPIIIYTIDSINPEYSKDGWACDDCNFSIISISDDYANLQLIVAQVRAALEIKKTSDTDRITMTGQDEGYNITESVFMNKLTFNVKIITY